MNAQEIFDTVVINSYRQGRPASKGKSCMYRSEDGLKCFIGFLIPDSEYDEQYEDMTASGLLDSADWLHEFIKPNDLDMVESAFFVDSLQQIHDRSALVDNRPVDFKKEWANEFKKFAAHHKLNTSVLKETYSDKL